MLPPISDAGEHFDGCVITPGFVNAHSHIEYAVYAGSETACRSSPGSECTFSARLALAFEDMVEIATVGAHECLRSGVTTIGDCSFSGATATAAAATGLRAIVYLEVFSAGRPGARARSTSRTGASRARSPSACCSASPRMRRTRARIETYRACAELGLPQATHFAESAAERDWLVDGTGDWSPLAEFLVPPSGETGIRMLAAEGLLGPNLMAAHCVHADAEEIGLLAQHGVGVAHCPRSNGYLGCGVAPLRELRDAGVAVSIATDSPASTPSLDLFDEIRTAIVAARAREGRPDALTATDALELATLGGARVLGMDDRVGSLVPGKQADLAVVSLVNSPFDPVEDPVTAAVLGGSPDRVTATLVAGEQRYLKGTSRWPDSTRAARSARSRMLP